MYFMSERASFFGDVEMPCSFLVLSQQGGGQGRQPDKINEADIKICMKIRIINILCFMEDLN